MGFAIRFTDSAIEDLDFFRKTERRMIADGIALFLAQDANVETRRRKPLRRNRLCVKLAISRAVSERSCW